MQRNADVEVAIIGAGAAGLGAARKLMQDGRSFVVLEASHRIGGRAYTEMLEPGIPFDLGAHWIHSASVNPLLPYARANGFDCVEETDDFPWTSLYEDGQWLPDSATDTLYEHYEAQFEAITAVKDREEDCAVADLIDTDSRWFPYVHLFFGQDFAHDADQVSAADACAFRWLGGDWAVADGLGVLLAHFGAGVPVECNAAVREIDWSGSDIRVTGSRGTIRARKVIVTVSTGVLATQQIQFSPRLPPWKRDAINALTMGHCTRIGLAFAQPLPADLPDEFTIRSGEEEPLHYRCRPFERDYIEVVTGGRQAEWMEKSGEAATLGFVLHRLKDLLGRQAKLDVRKKIVTAWTGDPWTHGAYSSALPGHADARRSYAQAIDERIFFAGEAALPRHYSTVHGALFSGEETAARM